MPPAAAPAMASGAMNEVCLPASSLVAGDNEGMETPAVGDPVDFTATGTVSRLEGDNAYITLESVNGDPIASESAEPASSEPNADDLMAQAQEVDKNPEY